ncbi:hypothetical protein IVB41_34720 [Bradyrhizobium sp. 44]|jgi:hypothetical protein|uniref:hypothetical protein n=1 Tax=Bradyrhizobium sp. 44 TaxID=2782675 RepID=UPI001FFC0A8A|nr:hypothetical protein [Bradyrhizobium sp. 44]MCK1289049.1 hypothetical protein [Bradyrhizobium sp. 44]
METNQYFKSMSAFCKQRAKMDGESELFWLTEAELLERLAETNRRLDHLVREHGAQAA